VHKLNHPNKDKIVEAIQRKEKWYWIEYTYKCSTGTISRYRKELGLDAPAPKLTPEDRQRILELRVEKKLTELADMFGVSDSYVSKLCCK
jgi:hypothetical protein